MNELTVVDGTNTPHYVWGEVCDGWRLLDHDDLSVILERVPPGAGEIRHYHSRARQFVYLISGRAVLELADRVIEFGPGQGVHIPPGAVHRFANGGDEDVVFLVVSAPPTSGDRINIE